MLTGSKIPSLSIGDRNRGCPSWGDVLGKVDYSHLPMQNVDLSPVKLHIFQKYALGTYLQQEWHEAERFIVDASVFEDIGPINLHDSTCTLTAAQVRSLLGKNFYKWLPKGMKPRGVVRAFLLPEPWKDPPRQRLIHWLFSINAMGDRVKPHMDLLSQKDVRFLVNKGPLGVSIDVKSCFNQFPNSDEVGQYQCLWTPEGWVYLARLAMGGRFACKVADTALKVMCHPCTCHPDTYIDNAHLAGEREALRADLEMLHERSLEADLTWNEDLSDPDSLIREEIEFLGLMLHHGTKKVRLAKKVLRKLASVWDRVQQWTVHDLIVCVAVLVYCYNVTGRHRELGRFSAVLRLWARAQGDAQLDPHSSKLPLLWPNDAYKVSLASWVQDVLTNPWIPVPPKLDDQDDDFLAITDGCKSGWAGLIISLKSGQCTLVHGHWPAELQKLAKHSAFSEPMALLATINSFFHRGVKTRVRHIGDNKGNQGVINKGYSTKGYQVQMEYLAVNYPGLSLRADYYKGALLPADEPSRDLPLDISKLLTLTDLYKVTITDIRELTRGDMLAE